VYYRGWIYQAKDPFTFWWIAAGYFVLGVLAIGHGLHILNLI
jgi:uncharacterized protein (DUF2236 family)